MDRIERERVIHLLDDSFKSLLGIFEEMYELSDDFVTRKTRQFEKHLTELFEVMQKDVEMKKLEMIKEMGQKLDILRSTHKALGLLATDPALDGPLSKNIARLDELIENVRELKEARERKLADLSQKIKELSERLVVNSRKLKPKNLTQDEIDDFENELFVLSEEKVRRQDILLGERRKIMDLMRDLDLEPSSAFECFVFDTPEDLFPLNQDTMDKVHDLLTHLNEVHTNQEREFETLSTSLESIWKKINCDEEETKCFKSSLQGIGTGTLAKMKVELDRCNEIRRSRLEPLLDFQRKKLIELWDKLTITQDQRDLFHPFFDSSPSEDLLELCEKEVERMEELYKEREEILQLAEKRSEMWKRRLQLEEAANDKTRLHNRGGQLLQEEKERKSLELNLPKVEQKLKNLIEQYEKENEIEFKWHGKDLLIQINSDWENYKMEKEVKKQIRKVEHSKTLEMETRLGTQYNQGTKRKFGGQASLNDLSPSSPAT